MPFKYSSVLASSRYQDLVKKTGPSSQDRFVCALTPSPDLSSGHLGPRSSQWVTWTSGLFLDPQDETKEGSNLS